jgi:hypothetical protein
METHAAAIPAPVPISLYYVAHLVRERYHGLLIAVPARGPPPPPPRAELAASLRQIAAHVRLGVYRKHPRGPAARARRRATRLALKSNGTWRLPAFWPSTNSSGVSRNLEGGGAETHFA